MPRAVGRPSKFTAELANKICTQITEGKSLRAICLAEDMPAISNVVRWLGENKAFQEQYAIARENQADTLADEILHIADTPQLGMKKKILANGTVEVQEGDMLEHRKLQVDTRKWIAARLKPKKYGDRVENLHTGDPEKPIAIATVAAKW